MAAEKRGTALNLAFLAPLAPLRTYVLGSEANERAATPAETKVMAQMLRDAMDAGAWGFSTTASRQHIGHGGKPLAARLASRDELTAFGAVLKQLNRGVIELALTKAYATLADDEYELLDFMLSASGRPVTWLSLHNLIEKPNGVAAILDRIAPLLARGAKPQILTRPLLYDMNLRRPFQFTEMKAAKPLFDASSDEQKAIYADAGFRAAFDDDLNVKFVTPRANTDPVALAAVLRDSRTMIGLSDAGAHLDMLCEAGYTTYLLGYWVREQKALSLEHAIKRITSEPADFFGFKGRGRLQAGAAADVVVFDENTISSPLRPSAVKDLPAGGTRLYCKASGVRDVIVNGQTLYENGRHTGAIAGQILRSGG